MWSMQEKHICKVAKITLKRAKQQKMESTNIHNRFSPLKQKGRTSLYSGPYFAGARRLWFIIQQEKDCGFTVMGAHRQ